MKKKKIDWKSLIQSYKLWIPCFLTCLRIIVTPILIVLGVTKQFYAVVIIAVIASLTDCLDGFLARKWNSVSEIGAKLDTVADKVFTIGLCLCFTSIFSSLWIIIILEFLLAGINLYFHYKSKKTESLWIGKIKTTILFITILFVVCSHFFPNITNIIQGLIYVCVNLQILCILEYTVNFYDHMHPITVEDNFMHQTIMNESHDELEQQTIELTDLKELVEQLENDSM